MYSRRNNLVISGNGIPPSSPNECLEDIVIQLFKSNLNVDITQGDISIVHRLGKPPSTSHDMRSILVRFTRRSLKYNLQSAAKIVKSDFYLNDHLTQLNGVLFYEMRQLKKKFSRLITSVYTRDGIVMYKRNGSPPRRISTQKELMDLSSDLQA